LVNGIEIGSGVGGVLGVGVGVGGGLGPATDMWVWFFADEVLPIALMPFLWMNWEDGGYAPLCLPFFWTVDQVERSSMDESDPRGTEKNNDGSEE
jgi:hypothetical protein